MSFLGVHILMVDEFDVFEIEGIYPWDALYWASRLVVSVVLALCWIDAQWLSPMPN